MNLETFAKLFQVSFSPIALISGASLLLLSVTNRLGRIVDRSRVLVREIESGRNQSVQHEDRIQLGILIDRAHMLRRSVLAVSLSIFLSVLMILCTVIQLFAQWELKGVILVLLFLSTFGIGIAILFLVVEVSISLKALELEAKRHLV